MDARIHGTPPPCSAKSLGKTTDHTDPPDRGSKREEKGTTNAWGPQRSDSSVLMRLDFWPHTSAIARARGEAGELGHRVGAKRLIGPSAGECMGRPKRFGPIRRFLRFLFFFFSFLFSFPFIFKSPI
jgi:hypothetical protein